MSFLIGRWRDEDAARVLELQLVESVKIQEECLQLMEEIRGGKIERIMISDGAGCLLLLLILKSCQCLSRPGIENNTKLSPVPTSP